jgi:two-component system response regulator MprA
MRGMVLVIDDDDGVRAVMATALEDDGWTVQTAENGRTALESLRSARPEAIILDLRMPSWTGSRSPNATGSSPSRERH